MAGSNITNANSSHWWTIISQWTYQSISWILKCLLDATRRLIAAPPPPLPPLTISQLYIYPVKSCAGIRMPTARFSITGLENDRRWVVVDAATKRFVSQRQLPQMALIRPRFHNGDDGVASSLVLTVPGMDDICVPINVSNDDRRLLTKVQVWDDWIDGLDEGDHVAAWLSTYLQRDVRLMVKDDRGRRPLSPNWVHDDQYHYETQTAFADGYPLLVVSESSLNDVSQRVPGGVDARNFRPNIVLDGGPPLPPFAEDHWSTILINEQSQINLLKLCSRCTIPNVDPDTGHGNVRPTLARLMDYRRIDPEKKYEAFVGVNAVHCSPGDEIHEGDAVKVLSFK